jgi:hypothetical protein
LGAAHAEEEARRHAEALAQSMGITFHVVRTPQGDLAPVQLPPEASEIVATFEPPESDRRIE